MFFNFFKILNIPQSEDLVIPAFTKIHFCDHQHLQNVFSQRPNLMTYLPDQLAFNRAPKALLFTILYSVERNLYSELKQTYKALREERAVPTIKGFGIEVSEEMFNFLSTFRDLNNTEVVGKSNFVKSSKKGNRIGGLMDIEN